MRKLFILIIAFFVICGCSNFYKGISYEEKIVDDKLILLFYNNLDYCIDIDFKVYFYDEDNYEINKIEKSFNSVVIGNSVLDLGNIKKYDHYNISYNYKESKICIDKKNIKVQKQDIDGFIKLKVSNNNNIDVNINIGVLYYLNGNVISYDGDESLKINQNSSSDTTLYYPSESIKNLDFDDFKIIINQIY